MLKRNLFFLFSVTLFAIASLVLDIFNYNPFEAGQVVFINFYASLFFSLTGVLAFCIYFFKFRGLKDKAIHALFWPSIRQGALASSGLVVLIILKNMLILDIWVGSSVFIIAVLLELFFQTKKTKNKPNNL